MRTPVLGKLLCRRLGWPLKYRGPGAIITVWLIFLMLLLTLCRLGLDIATINAPPLATYLAISIAANSPTASVVPVSWSQVPRHITADRAAMLGATLRPYGFMT